MNLGELQPNSNSWSWEIKNNKTLHLHYHFADLQVSCNMVPESKEYLNGNKEVLIPSCPFSIACLALKYHVQLFPHLCSIHSDLENYLQFPKCTCCFTSLLLHLFFPCLNSLYPPNCSFTIWLEEGLWSL